MSDAQHILECRSVTKSFGAAGQKVAVLKGIDLAIGKGESVAITGVSGSGKSSLLHLMGGLDTPDDGQVMLAGRDLGRIDESELCRYRNRHIGFVYQFHHLLGDFTILENVSLPLRIAQHSAKQSLARARDALAQIGLQDRLRHKPHQLSGGERQRAAVCRALVMRPDIILADEPTGQLDHKNALNVAEQMIRLNRETGIALVVATHDREFAARLDSVCRLEDGCLRRAA